VPVAGYDRVAGTISLLLSAEGPAATLTRLPVGEAAALDGPLGRGFAVHARSRYLLLVADVDGFPRLRALVDEAVADGRQVTVLLGARTVAEVYPSSLLPEQVEYVVATLDGSLGHRGHVLDLVPAYEAWADQCFGAGEDDLLGGLAKLARGRDGRMGVARLGRRPGRRVASRRHDDRGRAWLQLALRHDAGCALGICAGCVLNGADGPLRACREGPAVTAEELRSEGLR
jgi:dihydroorotate dehydrogenase electron transfer subunit